MNKFSKRTLIITSIILTLSVIAYYVWRKFVYIPTQQLIIMSDDTAGDLTGLVKLEGEEGEVDMHTLQNWQWRGENRNGMYNETGLLKEWPTNGPPLLWRFEGLGEGHTSVAIANGKIYITGLKGGILILYVFDMNGTLLTEKKIGKEWDANYDGPRSSVCVNEGKLYIFNAFGHLYCLNETTLNVIWTKDLLKDFDGRNLSWGITENPLIVDGKIFMTPGGIKHNMVALNKNTGELIWSSPGESTSSAYCSPIYIDDQSVPMVVTNMHQQIIAFNAGTGEKLWSFPQKNAPYNIHPNIPIYSDGLIFSTTGYKGGSLLLRLTNGGKAVEQVWKNTELDNQMGSAVRIGDYVYASGHQNNNWFCVNWKTGETMYKTREVSPANVISADGMLYVYSEKGTMNLIKPNPDKFELISSFKVTLGTAQHWAHPVIHEGVLYIRHGDALMAYKVK
jgi:outer membrane protein assembly factor BamB